MMANQVKFNETSQQHPKASAVRSVLRTLTSSSDDVEASAAITTDGFVIGAVLDEGCDENRFAAMSASLLALAERAAQEVSRGELKQLLIEGTNGLMLLVHAGSDAVLAVSARPTVNLGKVFIDARKSAAKINELL
jgi:predicted regulator of Ras-like GTPase activity (Roadblock/LC7/MglB family)